MKNMKFFGTQSLLLCVVVTVVAALMTGCPQESSEPPVRGEAVLLGIPVVGQRLTVDTDMVDPSIRWLRGASAIPMETGSSLIVTEADLGYTIRAELTLRGHVGSVLTEPTGVVTFAPDALTIIGEPFVGQTLNVITDIQDVSVHWERVEPTALRVVRVTTGMSHTVTDADVGYFLRAAATRAGSHVVTSNPTSTITVAQVQVDFRSHQNDAGIWVSNNTPYRLVALWGSLTLDKLLGGIPANISDFALWRNPAILNRTQSSIMFLVKYEDFKTHRNNLSAAPVFTAVLVAYTHGIDNPQRHEISGAIGGANRLIIVNSTEFDAEIRRGGVSGEILAVAPRGLQSITIPIHDGSHHLFVVFRIFVPSRNVVTSHVPRRADGRPWSSYFAFTQNLSQTQVLNIAEALDNLEISLGAAWIQISNESTQAVGIVQGQTMLTDSLGWTSFSPGSHRIVEISMAGVGDAPLQTSRTISSIFIGPPGDLTPLVAFVDGAYTTSFEVATDMQYLVSVIGDVNRGTLRAVIDLENATPVTINDLRPPLQ